jgi:hypothetical protein
MSSKKLPAASVSRLPPVFFVCGAFGSGKSTLAPLVANALPDCYVLDVDWLMESLVALSRRDLYEEAAAWPALGDVWLAIIDSVARPGRSTVLFSPCEPHELEYLRLRSRLGESHWLLLDCGDNSLRLRLSQRLGWTDAKTVEALTDARRMRTLGLQVVRTDLEPPTAAADRIAAWVRGCFSQP